MPRAVLIHLLIVPPINLLLLTVLGFVFHRRRFANTAMGVGLAGLFLFSLPITPDALQAVLEHGFTATPQPDPAAPPQAVVILSGDQSRIGVAGGVGFRPGPLTLEREQAGAVLARATLLPVLVSGGAIHSWSPPLAGIMAASLARDFLLTVRWQEDRSGDTWANARNSAAMLRQAGITRVYLVTHAWHMRRAMLAFRRAGLTAVPAVVAIDAKPRFTLQEFLPSAQAWVDSYYMCHELIGLAWYAIRP